MRLEQQRRLVDALLAQQRDEDGDELTEEAKEFILHTCAFYEDSEVLQKAIMDLRRMEKDELEKHAVSTRSNDNQLPGLFAAEGACP